MRVISGIFVIVLIIASFFFGKYTGEKNVVKANHNSIIKKYIIIDENGITHKDERCFRFLDFNIGVTYKEVNLLNEQDLQKVCPICIDAEDYENLIDSLKKWKR